MLPKTDLIINGLQALVSHQTTQLAFEDCL